MMVKRKIALIISIILALACGCMSTYAAIKTSVSVPGTVKTGV